MRGIRTAIAVLVGCVTSPLWSAEDAWRDTSLPTIQGGETAVGQLFGRKATVLVFLSADCPISNGYVPTFNRIAKAFPDGSVAVVGLNPNFGQSLRAMQLHGQQYQIAFPVVKDVRGTIAKQFSVDTCPEAILLDSAGKIAYRGRIDDRYVKRGGAAREVGRADLERAMEQVLAGTPVEVPRTQPLGCPVDFPPDNASAEPAAKPGAPTYCRDVARIIQERCQECHRPGGIGPFALTNYTEARRWADDIQAFTASRAMPPWKAVAGYGEFASPRSLSDREIELLDQWVAAGCPEGDPAELPPVRTFTESWKLGREPDAILEIPEYTVAAEGPDEYRCFVIPTRFPEDRFVTAMEVLPGNARVVHHVIAFLDTNGKARDLDDRHPGPGYITSAGFPGFFPSGGLGGWAPGNQPHELPAGTARLLPKHADIALQVHYHRSGKLETDRTRVALYFSRTPVTRAVRNVPVMPLGGPLGDMRIPAGDAQFEVKSALVLPNDMRAVGVTPHMHLLGKDMTVVAKIPNGETRRLIRIEDWDFNWQESYAFREPVDLPRGTRVELVAHFDNSEGNLANPARPPQEVRWGESTNEEMCIAFVEMFPLHAEQGTLKPPTRDQQLRFLIQSQFLDTETPQAEKALLLMRFLHRMNELEKNGGLLPSEK